MSENLITFEIEAEGSTDEITVPEEIVDILRDDEDEPASVVIGDLALLAFAQQAHGLVHHGHGDIGEDIEAAEAKTMELFEERFGQSFGEMTGHSH